MKKLFKQISFDFHQKSTVSYFCWSITFAGKTGLCFRKLGLSVIFNVHLILSHFFVPFKHILKQNLNIKVSFFLL